MLTRRKESDTYLATSSSADESHSESYNNWSIFIAICLLQWCLLTEEDTGISCREGCCYFSNTSTTYMACFWVSSSDWYSFGEVEMSLHLWYILFICFHNLSGNLFVVQLYSYFCDNLAINFILLRQFWCQSPKAFTPTPPLPSRP